MSSLLALNNNAPDFHYASVTSSPGDLMPMLGNNNISICSTPHQKSPTPAVELVIMKFEEGEEPDKPDNHPVEEMGEQSGEEEDDTVEQGAAFAAQSWEIGSGGCLHQPLKKRGQQCGIFMHYFTYAKGKLDMAKKKEEKELEEGGWRKARQWKAASDEGSTWAIC
ncbi:hypothetical protein E1B28_003596 [Marasmius oreades]|uniref:Uncharacterized protein n=1 Tax=Marasmius oreades TaxID=181124 RepID=A0A9P7RM49_9AGAR|nr:uncharacterized protein E1B28_003596 [Marasmius oreades]KAG7086079.1 hypothetical protein E1B28_003596 [Marasmius oreades]